MRLLFALLLATSLAAAEPAPHPWSSPKHFEAPQTYPAPGFEQPELEPLFYDGPSYKGKPTRVFAYIGIPPREAGKRVPAMVLVHGGGGTAFPEWVKLWNSRGYAAIAMDTCGSVPPTANKKRDRHEHGGPPGWGGFDQLANPPEDQWPFHAVAAVLRAHSLLRSRPEIDPDRIGLTGISWGGYLTCIVAGVDQRYRFAAPVYGCGFLGENSAWKDQLEKLGPAGQEWLKRWDPSQYLSHVKVPMLWVTGTNDFAYPPDSLQKSYRLPKAISTLCVRVRMPHGHAPGQTPKEIHAFAEHILQGGPGLPRLWTLKRDGNTLSAQVAALPEAATAELNFTRDTGPWQKRHWETVPAEFAPDRLTIRGILPGGGVRAAYLNLITADGQVISSEHVEFP